MELEAYGGLEMDEELGADGDLKWMRNWEKIGALEMDKELGFDYSFGPWGKLGLSRPMCETDFGHFLHL